MSTNSKFQVFKGTDQAILALTPTQDKWKELALYFPLGEEYFYQAVDGVMQPIGKGAVTGESVGVGVKINGKVVGGVKTYIEEIDILDIPTFFDYNTYRLQIAGLVRTNGTIRIQ